MQEKIPCSCLIIAKNAERTLRQCIESVSFCAQILVGDDGSTDGTIALARSLGADVVKLKKKNSFAHKRNELTQYAQSDWILWLDADEVVTPELQKEIENRKWKMENASAFLIRRMDVFLGRKLEHGETANTWLVRLGKKDAGKWERSVHEVWNFDGRIERLDGEISHTSHPDIEEFLGKINDYTELEITERVKSYESRGMNTYLLSLISYLQLFIYPIAKFIQNYILRRGFLDGFPGFVMAYMMSLHSLIVRIKLIERLRQTV